MAEPDLRLINLNGLVEKLNAALAESEPPIALGAPQEIVPAKNPFAYRLRHQELSARAKYQLTQSSLTGFSSIGGLESEKNMGYVFAETGFYTDSEYGGMQYEALKFRTKKPLNLADGKILPECNIKLLLEFEEAGAPNFDRRNHLRKIGLIWVKHDLSDVLPNAWFLTEAASKYIQ